MKYQKQIQKSEYDLVVVGAGLSGLVCAANLVQAGRSVLVLEQHFAPGGMTGTFKRKGYLFNSAAHRATGIRESGSLHYILNKIGRQVKLQPLNPSYVVQIGRRRLLADLDLKKYRDNVVGFFPHQAGQVDVFIQDLLKIKKANEYITASGAGPGSPRLAAEHPFFMESRTKSTQEFVQGRFSDPEIVPFVTILGSLTALPFPEQSCITFAGIWSVFHTGEGMCLVEGGFQTLVDVLVDYIDHHGGQVVTGKMVDRIQVKHGKVAGVVTRDGQDIKSKVVVSSTSNEQTYLKMLGPGLLPEEFRQGLKRKRPAGSVFLVYLGLKEEDGRGLEHCTTLAWNNTDPSYDDRVKRWDLEAIASNLIITVSGKEMSPEGRRSVGIACRSPYQHPENWFIKGEDKTGYEAFKEKLARMLIKTAGGVKPDLESRIDYLETASPLTLERYTLATAGAIHGLAYTADQSGPLRGPIKTPLNGLYQVGHYVFPGAGVQMVAASGNLGARMILDDHFSGSHTGK